jgi:hypothetical protein
MRWLTIIAATIIVALLCAGAYFRLALRPIEPLPTPAQSPQTSYTPPFRTLSANEKAHILDGQFSIEKNVNQLPDALKSEFARLAGESEFKMANPGQEYQSTDVVVRPGLPRRRLLFAGKSDSKIFVLYEEGGIGHSYHVAVFGCDPKGNVKFLWIGAGFYGAHAATHLTQLRAMIAAGKFADDQPYYW